MSTIIDKALILSEIKLHYKFRSDTEFANFLGIAPTTLSSWYKRKTFDYDLVYAKCVDIGGDWLLTGDGNMLRSAAVESGSSCSKCADISRRIDELQYIIDVQKELITELKEKEKRDTWYPGAGHASVADVG